MRAFLSTDQSRVGVVRTFDMHGQEDGSMAALAVREAMLVLRIAEPRDDSDTPGGYAVPHEQDDHTTGPAVECCLDWARIPFACLAEGIERTLLPELDRLIEGECADHAVHARFLGHVADYCPECGEPFARGFDS